MSRALPEHIPAPGATGVILDDTALLALGTGSRWLSGLVIHAASRVDEYVFAPALCLSAAVAERPLLADHIGGLPSIGVLDLTHAGACLTGALVAGGTSWRQAHAVVVARPSPEWPTGMAIVTVKPEAYAGHGDLRILPAR